MSTDFFTLLAVAGAAAIASPLGGLISLWRRPTTLFMSVALGFASGVLLATIGFEMLPKARMLSSLPLACTGFALGFAAIYLLDLFVHHGMVAGSKADEEPRVARFYRRHRPRGKGVTVLAAGTGAEELIEGLSIGVGAAITPRLGMLIALAIVIDNLSEGLSIGEIIRSERNSERRDQIRRILGWTGLIGAALLGSALGGWLLLQRLPESVLGLLFAIGGGGMFYLVITDLVPQAEERQYQESAALATAAGLLVIFILSDLSS
jgi:zinc transporter, ZIP family